MSFNFFSPIHAAAVSTFVLICLSMLAMPGHLMGKKSTDAQIESEERDRGMGQSAASPTGERDSDRTLEPNSPFWLWIRTVLSPEPDKVSVSQTLKQVQKMLEDRRQMEEQRALQRHLNEVGVRLKSL